MTSRDEEIAEVQNAEEPNPILKSMLLTVEHEYDVNRFHCGETYYSAYVLQNRSAWPFL